MGAPLPRQRIIHLQREAPQAVADQAGEPLPAVPVAVLPPPPAVPLLAERAPQLVAPAAELPHQPAAPVAAQARRPLVQLMQIPPRQQLAPLRLEDMPFLQPVPRLRMPSMHFPASPRPRASPYLRLVGPNLRPLVVQNVTPSPPALQFSPEQAQAYLQNMEQQQEMLRLQQQLQQQQQQLRQQQLHLMGRPLPAIVTPPVRRLPFTPSPDTSSPATDESILAVPLSPQPGPSWRGTWAQQ